MTQCAAPSLPAMATHDVNVRPKPSTEEALALIAALALLEHETAKEQPIATQLPRWAIVGRRAALRARSLELTRNRNGSW